MKIRAMYEGNIKNGHPFYTTIEIPDGDYSVMLDLDYEKRLTETNLEKRGEVKRWVTSEVLPAIRRHGIYATDELIANPDLAIAAFTALKEEQKKVKALSEQVVMQQQQITEISPKAFYYDVVISCKDLVAISVIAKDYGWSANRLNSYLNDKGVQYKQGKIWLLYQKYAEKGYTSTKTFSSPDGDGEIHSHVHTYWTQAGRLFVYHTLKADGILPLIEQEA